MATLKQIAILMALTENSSPSEQVYVNYRQGQEMARKFTIAFQVKHCLPFSPQMVHIFLQFDKHFLYSLDDHEESLEYMQLVLYKSRDFHSHKIFGVQKMFHDVVLKWLHKQCIVPLNFFKTMRFSFDGLPVVKASSTRYVQQRSISTLFKF